MSNRARQDAQAFLRPLTISAGRAQFDSQQLLDDGKAERLLETYVAEDGCTRRPS
jgi:hypothetical protein